MSFAEPGPGSERTKAKMSAMSLSDRLDVGESRHIVDRIADLPLEAVERQIGLRQGRGAGPLRRRPARHGRGR